MKQFTTLYRQGEKALAEKDCPAVESSRGQEKDLINLYPEILYRIICFPNNQRQRSRSQHRGRGICSVI